MRRRSPRLLALDLAGDRNPICRHTNDVGTLQRRQPERLGKPYIAADRHRDAPDRRVEHRKTEITRLEPEVFLVPQMHLAKRANMTLGAYQNCAVEQPRTVRRVLASGPHANTIS